MSFQDPPALLFFVISFSGFPVVDARDMLPQNLRRRFLFLPVQSAPHGLPYCNSLTIPADMYKLAFIQYVIRNSLNISPTSCLFCFNTATPLSFPTICASVFQVLNSLSLRYIRHSSLWTIPIHSVKQSSILERCIQDDRKSIFDVDSLGCGFCGLPDSV